MKQTPKPDTVTAFKPGDRVFIPTGQTGTIQRPPWCMPCHELVKFDSGKTTWILRELLSSAPDDAA